MKWNCFSIFLLVGFLVPVFPLSAADSQSFTGRVHELSEERVILKKGERSLEINRRDNRAKLPPNLKLGDEITVWYEVEITRSKAGSIRRQEAGEKPSNTIIDDRAYYSADNDAQAPVNARNAANGAEIAATDADS